MKTAVVVPFRLDSSRFPNKMLALYDGRSLLETAVQTAAQSGLGDVIITAPSADYKRAAESMDLNRKSFRFIPSSLSCRCGSERLLDIYKELADIDIFITIPADEALLNPAEVRRAAAGFNPESDSIRTLYCNFFCSADAFSPLSAKITADSAGRMLYISRAVIPASKTGEPELLKLKKNVGVFYFNRGQLNILTGFRDRETVLDRIEGLEQLRWLELGLTVGLKKIEHYGFGIDVPEQIPELEERLKCLQAQKK